jgi:hypothetical protein
MQATDSSATPASGAPEFSRALELALKLDASDQRRLLDVLAIVSAPDTIAGPTIPGAPAPLDDPPTVQQWIASVQAVPARERLSLIEEALQGASEAEAKPLEEERRAIFQQQPALAVRVAVERAVSHSPLLTLVGVVGIAFALYAVVRGVFRLVL